MARTIRECPCGNLYDPDDPRKPGPIHLCADCGIDLETSDPLMACVSWENKHTPIITITDSHTAQVFNAQQRRQGNGPLSSIVQPKEARSAANYSKRGSGGEDGAQYTTRLGEKRTVRL
jgi:hypothetical protein